MSNADKVVEIERIQFRVLLHLFEDILICEFQVFEAFDEVSVWWLEVCFYFAGMEEVRHCLSVLVEALKGRA